MSSYKIYITKSYEVARIIAKGLKEEKPWSEETGKILETDWGYVHESDYIPTMYCDKGYCFAMVKYRNGEDDKHPEYQIIIA